MDPHSKSIAKWVCETSRNSTVPNTRQNVKNSADQPATSLELRKKEAEDEKRKLEGLKQKRGEKNECQMSTQDNDKLGASEEHK